MSDVFNLEDLWNNSQTTYSSIKMNVEDQASHSDSKLLELLINDILVFYVGKTGDFASNGNGSIAEDLLVGDNIAIGGNASVGGTLTVTGDAQVDSLDVGGNHNVTGNQIVAGDAVVGGNHSVTGNQNIAGNQEVDGDVVISGNITAANLDNTQTHWIVEEEVSFFTDEPAHQAGKVYINTDESTSTDVDTAQFEWTGPVTLQSEATLNQTINVAGINNNPAGINSITLRITGSSGIGRYSRCRVISPDGTNVIVWNDFEHSNSSTTTDTVPIPPGTPINGDWTIQLSEQDEQDHTWSTARLTFNYDLAGTVGVINKSDGSSWTEYIPTEGWEAYVKNTGTLKRYQNQDWDAFFTSVKKDIMLVGTSEEDDLVVGNNLITMPLTSDFRLKEIRAFVTEAPSGSSIDLDINVNGSGNSLSIADGSNIATSGVDISAVDMDLVSFDINQVGSTNPGKGLKIILKGEV